jgi:TPR repeat protein
MQNNDSLEKAKTAYLTKNYKEAFNLFKKQMKTSPESAYYLGLMYYHGYYVDADDIQAFNLFKMAWEGLYEDGIYMLGRMYEEGRGIEKNYEQAFKLYQAAKNSQAAKLRIANFYEYGKYVEKSVPTAIKLYNELQKQGNAFAMYKIGSFYFSGEGLKKDLNNAYKWLNKALLKGSIEAMNHFRIIGTKSKTDFRSKEEIYETAKSLIAKQQTEVALPYLEVAAMEGYLPAILDLYELYKYGKGVDLDLIKAHEILIKYQELKFPEVYFLLGQIYELGEGVDSSFIKAAKYYGLGADLGHVKSQEKLLEIRGY